MHLTMVNQGSNAVSQTVREGGGSREPLTPTDTVLFVLNTSNSEGISIHTAAKKPNQDNPPIPIPQTGSLVHDPSPTPQVEGLHEMEDDDPNKTRFPTYMDTEDPKGQKDDSLPPDACAAILQKLSRMEMKLNKLDNLEVLYNKLNGEMVNMQTSMRVMTSQLGNVKSDLQKQEKKWAEVSHTMDKRLLIVEKGCRKMEQDWSTYKSAVNSNLNIAQTSIDSNSSEILEIKRQVETLGGQFKSLEKVEKRIIAAAEGKFEDMQTAVKNQVTDEVTKDVMITVRYDQTIITRATNYEFMKGRAFAKRMNLVMLGLPESNSPGEDRAAAADFFKDKLNLPNIDIAEVHRMGTITTGAKPRPLAVRFTRFCDRMAVWRKKGNLAQPAPQEGEPVVWIQEDLPKQLREDSRVLHKIARAARALPDRYGGVQVQDFQLRVNGKSYAIADTWTLPKELTPEMVFSPRTDEATVFFTKFSPLSNHFRCYFNHDGKTFCCVEQFLAWKKALLAEDLDLAESALQEQEPADYKVILNDLKHRIQLDQWRKTAEEILPSVIRAKFKQNPALANFLKDTQQRRIGEASKDKFWGIGLPLEHKDVLNTAIWPKEGNLLGRTLMNIRQELLDQTT